jgi:hypothetical protein
VGRRIGGGRDYGGGLAGRESKVRFPLIAFVVVFLPPLLIVWLFLKNWFFRSALAHGFRWQGDGVASAHSAPPTNQPLVPFPIKGLKLTIPG